MAEGQAVTYKLTKKLDDMGIIDQLPSRIQETGNKREAQRG